MGGNSARATIGAMAGKPKQNMVKHLTKCIHVAPDVKAFAVAEQGQVAPPLVHAASWSHGTRPPPLITTALGNAWAGSSANTMSVTPSPIASPLLLSIPLIGEPGPGPASKRRRTSSFNADNPLAVNRLWTLDLIKDFGEDFCKVLIATRSSWNTAHNAEMRLFVQKWIPGAVIPDRRTLSGPILDREAMKVEEKLKLTLEGKLATFQTDGWKNKAKQAIVATMVTVDSEV